MTMGRNRHHTQTHANAATLDDRRTEMNKSLTHSTRTVTKDDLLDGVKGNVRVDGANGVDGAAGVNDGNATKLPLST